MKFIDNIINKIAGKVKQEMSEDIKLLNIRIDSLQNELGINNKINGLMVYIDDKASQPQKKSSDIELLKRITKLEGEKVNASN